MRYVLISVLLLSTGCATIFCGSHQGLAIESSPKGLEVLVDGEAYKTPVEVRVSRIDDHYVEFPNGTQITIISRSNPVMELNAIWFVAGIIPGFIALIVDSATGAHRKLSPDWLWYKNGVVYDAYSMRRIAGRPDKKRPRKRPPGK